MEINIEQQEMPLLAMKIITGKIKFNGSTPSYTELRESIAKKINAKINLIKIEHIYNDYRSQSAKIVARVYNNEAILEKFLNKKEKAECAKLEKETKKVAEEKKTDAQV